MRTTQRAALQCAGQTATHRTEESSLRRALTWPGAIQQQGEIGTISHVMASKIVGQLHPLPRLLAWQACACPTKAFLRAQSSATLEILHRFFVLLCRGARLKRAEVSPFSCLRIFLPRVQAITARFKFSDHELLSGGHRLCRRGFLS